MLHYERILIEGTPLLSKSEFKNRIGCIRNKMMHGNMLNFGGLMIPEDWAYENFLIVGMQGSGKSLITSMFLKSLLDNKQGKHSNRFIINNQKDDIIPIMYSYGYTFEDENLKYLNLLDKRSSRWNIAEDIRDIVGIREVIAELIHREEDGKEKYWDDMARTLAEAVMLSYVRRYNTEWTFSQFLSFVDMPLAELVEVLSWTPENSGVLGRIVSMLEHSPKTLNQIIDSTAQRLRSYKLVGVLSDKASSGISAQEFVTSHYSVVMRVPPEARETVGTYNRIFLRQVAKHFLSQPSKEEHGVIRDRTYFILDEFAALGRIEELQELLDLGRDRGLSVLIAFHDIDQVIKNYKEEAHSVLARFGNVALLRTSHAATQQWGSGLFGTKKELVVVESKSNQVSTQSVNSRVSSPVATWSNSRSVQGTMMENPVVSPTQFRVPPTRITGEIHGHFLTFIGGCYYSIPIEYALRNVKSGMAGVQAYDPHDLSSVRLDGLK
jgi:hypothetical protein